MEHGLFNAQFDLAFRVLLVYGDDDAHLSHSALKGQVHLFAGSDRMWVPSAAIDDGASGQLRRVDTIAGRLDIANDRNDGDVIPARRAARNHSLGLPTAFDGLSVSNPQSTGYGHVARTPGPMALR